MNAQELRELNATVSTKFEILSPDQMLDIQERSMEAIASGKIKQRNQTRYVVAKYVRDILNGDWCANPQPITLTPEGYAIDGLHRIAAGVKAGMPVLFNVTRNWKDAAAFKVMDTGRVRSNSVLLSIAGVENSTAYAAIARGVIQCCFGAGHQNTRSLSINEIDRTMHIFQRDFEAVLNQMKLKDVNLCRCGLPSEGIACMIFAHKVIPEITLEFASAFFGMEFTANHPARALRLWIDRSKGLRKTRGVLLKVVANGIQAMAEKQNLTRLTDKEQGILWLRKANKNSVAQVASIFGQSTI